MFKRFIDIHNQVRKNYINQVKVQPENQLWLPDYISWSPFQVKIKIDPILIRIGTMPIRIVLMPFRVVTMPISTVTMHLEIGTMSIIIENVTIHLHKDIFGFYFSYLSVFYDFVPNKHSLCGEK